MARGEQQRAGMRSRLPWTFALAALASRSVRLGLFCFRLCRPLFSGTQSLPSPESLSGSCKQMLLLPEMCRIQACANAASLVFGILVRVNVASITAQQVKQFAFAEVVFPNLGGLQQQLLLSIRRLPAGHGSIALVWGAHLQAIKGWQATPILHPALHLLPAGCIHPLPGLPI